MIAETEPALASDAGRAAIRVVVVTYSPGDSLERFLDSLPAAASAPVNVVLADNGSRDGAPERAAAAGRAVLVRTGGNLGYGTAANIGAAGGDEQFVLVANPDVVLEPGALDQLLAAADRHPQAGAFGPAVITDGSIYPSARTFPRPGTGIGHAMLSRIWPSNPWTAGYRVDEQSPTERRADWLSGCCMLLRREAFDEVGGFDPKFFMYCEDVDLCERLAEAGWDSVYVPSARIEHSGGLSTRRRAVRMAAVHHRSLYLYLAGRYPGARHLPLRVVFAVGLTLRLLVVVAAAAVNRIRGRQT